jgi:hypothetical protein
VLGLIAPVGGAINGGLEGGQQFAGAHLGDDEDHVGHAASLVRGGSERPVVQLGGQQAGTARIDRPVITVRTRQRRQRQCAPRGP